ncbi:MAG: helix-turn-helix domain-containing protein [Chitinophagaceae bacterium]|nr:MAG: helix-turn-helix domain-containing protein [Chitinophagaceae bacterium]
MTKLSILLSKNHRLLSIAAMLDLFETVNIYMKEKSGAPFFEISLLHTRDTEPVHYAGYLTSSIQGAGKQDLILLPAFGNVDPKTAVMANSEAIKWLQVQYKEGAAIASFCTGAFLLAATGLLNHRPATTHLQAVNAFVQAFPDVIVQPRAVVTEEDNVYTSGGATSSFHLMLKLVENYCGRDIAIRTAKYFAIDMDREQQSYFSTFLPLRNHGDELVTMVQQKISESFNTSNTIEQLLVEVPSSRRNLVRRFKQATGITPIEYLQKTRIEAAKRLLEQSRQSILEVMLETGYNDLKSFRQLFKKNVGLSPKAYREKFN